VVELGRQEEPEKGLGRLVFKIRTGGLSWIRKRIAAEATEPTTPAGRAIHAAARRVVNAYWDIPRRAQRKLLGSPATDDVVYAFWDLKVAPITFDFLWCLVGADLHRRRNGLASVHVVIVPGPRDGLRQERDDYETVIDPAARTARICNILLQACQTLPSCAGVTVAPSRDFAAHLRTIAAERVYPGTYEPALPVFPGAKICLDAARAGEPGIACLRAVSDGLRTIESWADLRARGRRVVTITLRRYHYMPARNSNLSAWTTFARSLDPNRYLPVFIPDTHDLVPGLPPEMGEFTLFPEAAWNVGLRMALYESAFLNLGVNNGPMGLCWLNERTRYATLKMETSDVPQTTLAFFRALGFEPGKSLPFATPMQEWVWEDDTQEAIGRAFNQLVAKIEAQATAA
jgi:hypothetical protein